MAGTYDSDSYNEVPSTYYIVDVIWACYMTLIGFGLTTVKSSREHSSNEKVRDILYGEPSAIVARGGAKRAYSDRYSDLSMACVNTDTGSVLEKCLQWRS